MQAWWVAGEGGSASKQLRIWGPVARSSSGSRRSHFGMLQCRECAPLDRRQPDDGGVGEAHSCWDKTAGSGSASRIWICRVTLELRIGSSGLVFVWISGIRREESD